MEISPQSRGDVAGRVSAREVELIRFRDGKVPVKFQLMTDDVIEGVVLWYDDMSVHVALDDKSELTIMFNVISTYGRR